MKNAHLDQIDPVQEEEVHEKMVEILQVEGKAEVSQIEVL